MPDSNIVITDILSQDIRFPTSRDLSGSDAMNPDPDYSMVYVTLKTNHPNLCGYGMTFTLGRGNELCTEGVNSLKHLILKKKLSDITHNLGAFWHMITGDSQLRWVGPEKGVIHLATAAMVNAVWDLYARVEKKSLWKLLVDMTPEQLVGCIDFRYITDFLTPKEAQAILEKQVATRAQREAEMREKGFPAYVTSIGWLGYPDEKVKSLTEKALSEGWTRFKMKVGAKVEDDVRRAKLIRDIIGPNNLLMMDANQVWDVPQAIDWMKSLAFAKPYWIEEPTSPDDVLGHAKIAQAVAPIKVATGEQCQNRILFKQFLQAKGLQILQADGCRLGGVNEMIAVILMAAKAGVPVCPHTGGVGLSEFQQHFCFFDYIAVSGECENHCLEYVSHLHEHFLAPVVMHHGHYMPPQKPGCSVEMHEKSVREYEHKKR
ncbi:MAG: fuconate dehydratase [Gammaproteobacteria bacterium RIFCSPHIGHO2_12_FULL_42_13]|nr:MAG: fuconate dehydratase [Gammaproteobacteria bacterium RIFCSPHIGHO2_12_FULL_42_13]